MKLLMGIPSVLVLVAAAGCSGTAQDSPSGKSAGTDSSSRSAAVTGGTIEFEDHFSSTGTFLVARSTSGELAVAVQDSIAKPSGLVEATIKEQTLAGIYSVLHPNQALPEALARLSREFEAASTQAPRAAAEPTPALSTTDADVLVEKNQSTFNSTVCKNIPIDSSSYWAKLSCNWNNGYLAETYCYASRDRSYAWNEMSKSASHTLNPCNVVTFSVPAYTYHWAWWNTTCYCPGARVMGTPNTGPCGVTIHRWTPIIH